MDLPEEAKRAPSAPVCRYKHPFSQRKITLVHNVCQLTHLVKTQKCKYYYNSCCTKIKSFGHILQTM